jgi:hypothetical protein
MPYCDVTTRTPKLAATFVAAASLVLTGVSCAEDSAGGFRQQGRCARR